MGPPHSFIAVLPALAVLLLVLLCAPSANGAITNTTIDDTNSAFTFSGSWTAVSPSDPCAGCSSKPDASQTFGETWHDGNYRTGASETTTGSFTFTGSAVYIFGIDQANSQPDIAFTLGSTQAVHHYTGTERFAYNALFFHATGLAADQTHTVNWIFNIDPSTGVGVQAALFDYAIVTSGTNDAAAQPSAGTSSAAAASPRTTTSSSTKSTSIASATSAPSANTFINSQSSSSTSTAAIQNQSATSSSTAALVLGDPLSPSSTSTSGGLTVPAQADASSENHSNTGAIVGAVLGALVLAILVLIIFFLCRRRVQQRRRREDEERAAVGLPPAQRMRIPRNGTLQPFVQTRTVAAPGVAGGAVGRYEVGPPAFVDGAGMAGRYPPDSKTLDVMWMNPQPHPAREHPTPQSLVTRQLSQSTQSSRVSLLTSPSEGKDSATTAVSPSDTHHPSARERYLEQRLATLEAHVASYLPPPYEQPEP